jgi:3-oxoacyl-[acyl-carrier protein] reductase
LAGKVGLVTGGGSGIGAAVCRAFAAEGATVAVLDVDEEAAARVAASLEPGRGLAVVADVSDSTAVDAAVDRVVAELGRLDVLVNNAGIVGRDEMLRIVPRIEAGQPLDATVALSDDEWRRMLATHLDGTFYCTRAAVRAMTAGAAGRRGGAIVNVASICGLAGCAGAPHYSAAKAGILGFTRSVAKEVVAHGIRVNAVAPGYVDTPMIDWFTPALRLGVEMQTPAGRLGTPEEIAAAIVFLASDEASFVVGQTVSPNGGHVTT